MRDLAAEEIAAIQARSVVSRDLFWITVINRDTGLPSSFGFSNLRRNVSISVKDGRTGSTVTRDFVGLGDALQIGSVPLVSDISIRTVSISLPTTDDQVANIIRGYDPRGAPCQIYRLFLSPDTMAALAAAKARFIGYVDTAQITTPRSGEVGSIKLNCVSTTRELTRTNNEVRSHESQIARSATDNFYMDTAVVSDWDLFWGQAHGNMQVLKTSGRRPWYKFW